MKNTVRNLARRYSFYLGGDQPLVTWHERFRSAIGAFIGLMLVITIAMYLRELSGIDEWLMASLGASALLVFVLPGSPMAQPWAVIAGNTLSALVGVSCAILFSSPLLALPMAAALSILGMFMLRCLHPPAAAVALIAVLGGHNALPLCLFPGDGGFSVINTGWGGLQ
ncbi:HPP family protein [Polynucleobacter sp. Tro8-14-1]|uniref:HPP family protein n=1 Tax=Polynucleobacter sp. Tro8-14-1 TaxID=1758383 RepID=UPI001C0BF90E|nr:HPP family protein [Polynucleobacter sp. Tro8-14-1]